MKEIARFYAKAFSLHYSLSCLLTIQSVLPDLIAAASSYVRCGESQEI
jgi:hypothetical protein